MAQVLSCQCFNSSNCQAQVAKAPRSHLAQRHPGCPVQTLLKEMRGVRNKHTWKQVPMPGIISHPLQKQPQSITGWGSLQNSCHILAPGELSSISSATYSGNAVLCRGKVLEGKSQHPYTHSPWHSLSPAAPQPAHGQFLSPLDYEELYGDAPKWPGTSCSELAHVGSQHVHFHSIKCTKGKNSSFFVTTWIFLSGDFLSVNPQFWVLTWNPDTNHSEGKRSQEYGFPHSLESNAKAPVVKFSTSFHWHN